MSFPSLYLFDREDFAFKEQEWRLVQVIAYTHSAK